MVKAYLRYEAKETIGLIAGTSSNMLYHPDGKHIITSANQFIYIINLKTSEVTHVLHDKDKNSEVTYVKLSNNHDFLLLAAGYADGDIILWDLATYITKCYFTGHNSNVTALLFNDDDSLLFSGSFDTSIIVWETLSESSLYKFNGHKNAITKIELLKFKNESKKITYEYLLTSSKDGLFKLWDINLQECLATIPGLTNEIWNFAHHKPTGITLIGSNSEDIQIVKIHPHYDQKTNNQKYYEEFKSFTRKSGSRIIEMVFDHSFRHLFILNSEKQLEIYKVLDEKEMQKKLKRKKKRLREKNKEAEADNLDENYFSEFSKHLEFITIHHFAKKAKSIAFNMKTKDIMAVNLPNNTVEVYKYQLDKPEDQFILQKKVDNFGHRTAVRTISIASDDSIILTGSGESAKLWSTTNFKCFRTFETGYCVSSLFLPGDKYFIIGDKDGNIQLFDINQAIKIKDIKAHEESIWSLHMHENPEGYEALTILSGGADKKVKLWALLPGKEDDSIDLVEVKDLLMVEEIHCVKYSPNGKYYGVSLMDNTIKLFYSDSDKLFLSLYGHKLPVLSFDISSDNSLLISGSADKNLKIWGMDFGNCHKSIFAHNDSIMNVQFVRDTHYFFSVSKDRVIKYWDGDTYQLILDFECHLAEIWALAVSSIGDFFITAGNDKSIRIFQQNKDQVFIQEEEEKRQEKMMLENYANERNGGGIGGNDQNLKAASNTALTVAEDVNKFRLENLKFGENVIYAIETAEKLRDEYMQYEVALKDYEKANEKQRHMMEVPKKPDMIQLGGLTIPEYVFKEISKIRNNDLENSLKFLHFTHIEKLLYYLKYFIDNNINIDLSTRILCFILQAHEGNIKNSAKLMKILTYIRFKLKKQLLKEQNIIGFNISALKFINKRIKDSKEEQNIQDDQIFQQRVNFV